MLLCRPNANQMQFFNENIGLSKSFRQPPNLLNYLNKNNDKPEYTTSKCNLPGCLACPSIIINSKFIFNNKTFRINADMDCNTQGVVYALLCQKCNELYIGETTNEVRLRMNQHRSNVRIIRPASLYVSKHLNACNGPQNAK